MNYVSSMRNLWLIQPQASTEDLTCASFHAQFAVTVQPSDTNQWTWVFPDKEVDYNDALPSYIE